MKSYGQFCSIARALDLLGERWTLLVVRELLCGSRRFAEIRRGIPQISKTMLSARLHALADAGVIARAGDAGGPAYALTPAGVELEALVRELGTWGQRWLPRAVRAAEVDVDGLLWDIQRRVRRAALPEQPVVVRFELRRVGRAVARHYLLLRRTEVSLCDANPGYPERVCVGGDAAVVIAWWRGDLDLPAARRAGLRLEGKREWVQAFPTWFDRYLFAAIPAAA
jgi:DNA-binding HxlR family transcriptional regulator